MNERLLTPLADYSRQALQVGTPPLYVFDDNERPASKELLTLSLQLRQVEALERQAAMAEAAHVERAQESNTGRLSKKGRELTLTFMATSLAMSETLYKQLAQVLLTLERLSEMEVLEQARSKAYADLEGFGSTLALLTSCGEVVQGVVLDAEQAEAEFAFLQENREALYEHIADLEHRLLDYQSGSVGEEQEWAVPLSAPDESAYRVIASEYAQRHRSFPERHIELVEYTPGQGFHLRFASPEALYFWGRQWGEAKGSGRVAAIREGRDTTPEQKGGPRFV